MKTLFIPDSVLNLIVKSPENLPEQAALLSAAVLHWVSFQMNFLTLSSVRAAHKQRLKGIA